MITYVKKVVREAHTVTEDDVDALREHGFSDEEILDIAMTAAARVYYGTILSATGAVPDETYLADEGLMDMLAAAGMA